MKKQILMSLIATLVTVSASASTKVVCAVNGESKPNEYARLITTKTLEVGDDAVNTLLHTFENGDVAYVTLNPKDGFTASMGVGRAGQPIDIAMAKGLQEGSYVGLLSAAHKVAVVCVLIK